MNQPNPATDRVDVPDADAAEQRRPTATDDTDDDTAAGPDPSSGSAPAATSEADPADALDQQRDVDLADDEDRR